MASDIPFDHRKCSLWQTRIAEIDDNGWMHGTVGGKSGRRVCLRESGRHRRPKPQNSARSSELGRSGLNQPADRRPDSPNSLKLDPLTGEILNPLPRSVVDRRHWRQQKPSDRMKHSSSGIKINLMLQSNCFRKGHRMPWCDFLKQEMMI